MFLYIKILVDIRKVLVYISIYRCKICFMVIGLGYIILSRAFNNHILSLNFIYIFVKGLIRLKRTTILNLNRIKLLNNISKNPRIFLFFVLFLLSLFCGCLLFNNEIFSNFGKSIFDFYYSKRIGNSFHSNLIFYFLVYFIFLFISYLFGTSIIGVAFVPAVIAFRGVSTALFICYIYGNYGFQAITYNLLIFVPATVISVLVLLTGASDCVNLSLNLGRLLFTDCKVLNNTLGKKFVVLFFVLTVLSFIAALINTLLSFAFLKYFSLG